MMAAYDPHAYTVVVRPGPADEGGYIARAVELPGCVYVGETHIEALEGIYPMIEAWMDAQVQAGRSIPSPTGDAEYSGRFTVRVPRWVHKQLAMQAEAQDASLNQYVTTILSHWAGQRSSPPVSQLQVTVVSAMSSGMTNGPATRLPSPKYFATPQTAGYLGLFMNELPKATPSEVQP
jgi:predicted RNase H-like HicB family nuclease